jgi:hypothetical protein
MRTYFLLLCVLLLLPVGAQAQAQTPTLDEVLKNALEPHVSVEENQVEEKPTEEQQIEEQETVIAPPTMPSIQAPVQNLDQIEIPPPTYEQKKFAVLQTLDKVTARTATVTVTVGQPQAVGPLFLDVKSCQKTPPSEQPEAAAFLQVWEAKPKAKKRSEIKQQQKRGTSTKPASQWVFSGWMFVASPALSAMDHPIYDVWLKDCTDTNK